MKTSRRTKWIAIGCAVIAFTVLAGIGGLLFLDWEECLYSLKYDRPLRYDVPFHPAIAHADRIVVRGDGFDCCGPVDETNVLFEVTDPTEVALVRTNLAFQPETTTNAIAETCLCCGGPSIDWYRGGKRIALTAVVHGRRIRWKGFSTSWVLGVRVAYGDGPLTDESVQWLADWLQSHGVGSE